MAEIDLKNISTEPITATDDAFYLYTDGEVLERAPQATLPFSLSEFVAVASLTELLTYPASSDIVAGYPVALADDLSVFQSATSDYIASFFPGIATESVSSGELVQVLHHGTANVPINGTINTVPTNGFGLWLLCGLFGSSPYYFGGTSFIYDTDPNYDDMVERQWRRCFGYAEWNVDNLPNTAQVYIDMAFQFSGGRRLESAGGAAQPSDTDIINNPSNRISLFTIAE